MSVSTIIITIASYVVVVSITDLITCLLMLIAFYASRKMVFSKFGIHPSFKKDKLFWVANKIIFLILVVALIMLSVNISTNDMGAYYGFTVQFI